MRAGRASVGHSGCVCTIAFGGRTRPPTRTGAPLPVGDATGFAEVFNTPPITPPSTPPICPPDTPPGTPPTTPPRLSDSSGASLDLCDLAGNHGRCNEFPASHEDSLRRLHLDDSGCGCERRRLWWWRRNQQHPRKRLQIDSVRVVQAGKNRTSDDRDMEEQRNQ